MKELNRRSFIKGALSLGAISALSGLTGVQARAEGESVYTPGTYTASAMGRDGQVTVHVTFDEKSIVEVSVDASAETENIGGIAAPILEEQVMKAQSSAIDGVSSATITSQAVKKAVADCIFEASGGKIVEGGDIAVKEDIPPVGGAANIDWLGTAPEIDESQITETFETEVLVVGAGNSGLMTAARAAVGGAKVLVIEKAISSQTERHWIGAVGTKEQEASGTVIDKNKLVAELAKYASHFYSFKNRYDELWEDNKILIDEDKEFWADAYAFWDNQFKHAYRKLDDSASEDVIIDKAQEILFAVRQHKLKLCKEELSQYISDGAFYYLSDKCIIGWHKSWKEFFKKQGEQDG